MTKVVKQAFADYAVPLSETVSEAPALRGTEVLMRVGHCGVCHSDLHLHDGYFDLGAGRKLNLAGGQPLPFTLGHEIEGAIEAAGPDAGDLQIERRVVIYPWIGCGECALCKRGDEHLCAKPRQIGGVGLHFVRNLMDQLEYARRGDINQLRLMKKIKE